MNTYQKLALCLTCILGLGSTSTQAGNLIQNGSFEAYTINENHGAWKKVTFNHWTGTGESWNANLGRKATNGIHKIELDVGYEMNELSQIITTVEGTKYKLSLDAYARVSNSSDFQILVDGEVLATFNPNSNWSEYNVYFRGTGGQQVLSLKEIVHQNNGAGTIIDNVRLEASTEMIRNGSFEHFTVNSNYGRWKKVTFDEWEGQGEAWRQGLGKDATNGAYKIELDVGRELNTLSQTVTTQKHMEYELTLDAYARLSRSSDFEIWVDDVKLETVKPTQRWENYSFKFFGNGKAQKISLKEVASQNNALGTIIDNISLKPTGKFDNSPPVIEGVAKKMVSAYNLYHFTPNTSDIDGDTLTFSIKNKPTWAEFDTSTGTLSGIPRVVGLSNDIRISVSDETFTASLVPFSIEVTNPIDIAHKFGKATQGTAVGYGYYGAPERAIDNNDYTYNHTRGGKNGENWLQIELPSPTKVSKIVLQNRNIPNRLKNAKIYISDTPYAGVVDENNLIQTLDASGSEQVISLDRPVSGTYLLIKGEVRTEDDRHLHLIKLEVYGETPQIPVFKEHESSYLIPIDTSIGSVITTLTGIDYQNDTITYSIENNEMFSIDEQGNISVHATLKEGDYTIKVTINDSIHTATTNLIFTVTSATAVADALASGSVLKVTEKELLQEVRNEIASLKDGDSLLSEIYQDGKISYVPGRYYSQLINIYGDVKKIFPIIYGNKNRVLAIAGQKEQSRFSAFSSNPFYFFSRNLNLDYEPYMKRILAWLIAGKPIHMAALNENRTIALSFTTDTPKIKSWMSKNYPNLTIKSCNNVPTLESCYNGVDLIILGRLVANDNIQSVRTTLEKSVASAIPILYLHENWAKNAFSETIADFFGFSFPYAGNNWANDAAIWKNYQVMQSSFFKSTYNNIDTMLSHFQDKDYSFDWINLLNDTEVVGFNDTFQYGASAVRRMISSLDYKKNKIFATADYRLQKLLVLLGDKFRETVNYPMDKVTTDDTEFLKSLYSDHSHFNYRTRNPVQPDMGNFSRSDFSHITPITKTVSLNSKIPFRSVGAYAIPGKTVRVTRNDNSNLTVKVFINTLRSGATHVFQTNGYNRPKFLQTPHFEIQSGESIELTSAYGGTLQLEFSANDLPVELTFENVGEHAYWASTADNDSFAQKLQANEYDWSEVATEGFEVHSKLDKMLKSISDPYWGTAESLAFGIQKYTSNYPHVLAGFKGKGIDVVPEIIDWAENKSLTVETIDKLKHMNADQASCGYGCSGNPYDAYWAFNPIGHGDLHELGHNLQQRRFEGFPNHAATNTFSYYTKSRFFANTGENPFCQGLPFKHIFETVQSAVGEANVTDYLKTNLWEKAGLGEQYLLKIQAMMHAQKMGKIENGWHLLARVHILEREMKRAKQDWEAKKASVGFSTYSLDEINTIKSNDWLIIAYSYAAQLDYRNYFDMMGIPFSQKAREQIESFNFDVVPNSLFVSTDTGYCSKDAYGTLFDRPTLNVDGHTQYPY